VASAWRENRNLAAAAIGVAGGISEMSRRIGETQWRYQSSKVMKMAKAYRRGNRK